MLVTITIYKLIFYCNQYNKFVIYYRNVILSLIMMSELKRS